MSALSQQATFESEQMNTIDEKQNNRIALGVEYDGSDFCGWQMQSHGTRTVQREIERAIDLANTEVRAPADGIVTDVRVVSE